MHRVHRLGGRGGGFDGIGSGEDGSLCGESGRAQLAKGALQQWIIDRALGERVTEVALAGT